MVTSPVVCTFGCFIRAMRGDGEFSFEPALSGELPLRCGDPKRGIPDRGGDALSKRLVTEGFLGEGVLGKVLVFSGDGVNGNFRGCNGAGGGKAVLSCTFTRSESELRRCFFFTDIG